MRKMDFDIGTLFYIVITVIAIVIGALGKKKKPAPGGNKTTNKKSAGWNVLSKVEEQIKDLFNESEESVKSVNKQIISGDASNDWLIEDQPSQIIDSVVADQEEPEISEEMYQDQISDIFSSESVRTTNKEDILQVIDMDIEHPDFSYITGNFDLKTAVIYSTIFYRKEF